MYGHVLFLERKYAICDSMSYLWQISQCVAIKKKKNEKNEKNEK